MADRFWIVIGLIALHIAGSSLAHADRASSERALQPPELSSRCAIVWEPELNITYFEKNADEHCITGSTAKIMTIHGTIWAIRNGYLDYSDPVLYSQKSVDQACTCIGDYEINKGTWPRGVSAIDIAQVGEKSTVEEALYGVAMSAAQPTVSLAELVAARYSLKTMTQAATPEESTEREIRFVNDVMNPLAAGMGATNTKFMNEHGDWKPLKPGVWEGNPYASPRDFVRMWNAMVNYDDNFLKYTGLEYFKYNSIVPDIPNVSAKSSTYVFSKIYDYYPRIEGDKSGGTTPPGRNELTSLVSGSTRLGRRLLVDVMEADVLVEPRNSHYGDTARLYKYAFEKIFKPRQFGSMKTAQPTIDLAMDCTTSGYCVSGEVTASHQLVLRVLRFDRATGVILQSWTRPAKASSGKFDPESIAEVEVIYVGDIDPIEAVKRPIFVIGYRKRNGATQGEGGVVLETWELGNGVLTRLDLRESASTGMALSFEMTRIKQSRKRAGLGVTINGFSRIETRTADPRRGSAPTRTPETKPRIQPRSEPQRRLEFERRKKAVMFVLARNTAANKLQFSTWSIDTSGKLSREKTPGGGSARVLQMVESGGDLDGFVAIVKPNTSKFHELRHYDVNQSGNITSKASSIFQGDMSAFGLSKLETRKGKPTFGVSYSLKGTPDAHFVTQWQHSKTKGFEEFAHMGPYAGSLARSATADIRPGGIVAAIQESGKDSFILTPMENDTRFLGYNDQKAPLLKLGESVVYGVGGEIVLRTMGVGKSHGVYATAMMTTDGMTAYHGWTIGE